MPCRVTNAIPTLLNGNSTVTLSDKDADVTVTGTGVAKSNFLTNIGGGDVIIVQTAGGAGEL